MQGNQVEFEVKPALCLDLDGTIRYSRSGDFINKIEDIALYDGVEEVIWGYRERGYLIFGITNQGGVAYKFKSIQVVEDEIAATRMLFESDPFDAVQFSVLHPDGNNSPFNRKTFMRKPEIGMLALCEAQMFQKGVIIDWENSIFVGDRPEDEECAQRAGIEFIWVKKFFHRDE